MASKIISITISDEVDDIINDMKKRDMNLSAHIRSLLIFSKGCGFVIPATRPVITDIGIDEEEAEEIRREIEANQ